MTFLDNLDKFHSTTHKKNKTKGPYRNLNSHFKIERFMQLFGLLINSVDKNLLGWINKRDEALRSNHSIFSGFCLYWCHFFVLDFFFKRTTFLSFTIFAAKQWKSFFCLIFFFASWLGCWTSRKPKIYSRMSLALKTWRASRLWKVCGMSFYWIFCFFLGKRNKRLKN